VNSRELIRWQQLAESRARRSRRGRVGDLTSSEVLALCAGGAIAGWVYWRGEQSPLAGSNAWFAVTLVAYATAFMRVPFHIYWRQDASLLAQLPIEGGPLFDAAMLRCIRAAISTTVAVAIGALPILEFSTELYLRHVAMAGALGTAAAGLVPAVAIWAAQLVAIGQRDDRIQRARAAAGITQAPGAPSTAALGAVPGFISTFVFVGVILGYRWLTGRDTDIPTPIVLVAIAGVSIAAIVATRSSAPKMMGTILRDVSALDRQRLATLEIRPPTAIERGLAKLAGADGALVYAKDARLVRRRFPMAFALGALAFLILAIVGLARPADPMPWLTATIVGGALYGVALAGRLDRPPIELARLSSTLPFSRGGITRAKLVWLFGWWTIFLAIPGLFASLRQADSTPGLALLGGGTILVLLGALLRR
jgi:hypothetical protein